MRRRPPRDDLTGVPARLLRYDPADWPNPECHPACAFWEARREWKASHPEDDMNEGFVNRPIAPFHLERI